MAEPRYDVFLSYNGKDRATVDRIAAKLRQNGIEPWLDSYYLPAGQRFQSGIVKALLASNACAVFIGPHGLGDWQVEELNVAQDRAVKDPNFGLFIVLLPGLPDPYDPSTEYYFLNMRTWVDFRAGFEDPGRFQHLINAIAGQPMGPTAPVARDPGKSPYRGLQVFDEEHAKDFFGREAEVQRLLEKLKASRFLAVVGPSGSGKSSLVRAGLLPALKNGVLPGSFAWPIKVFTPTGRPVDELAAQVIEIEPARSMNATLAELRENPRTLDQAATLLMRGKPATDRLVLVVDQFEEVFTLCQDEAERGHFLRNLLHAATVPNGRCVVIITLRADFYPRCAAYPELATLLAAHQVLLGPLDDKGLRAAIEQPAHQAGAGFEPGLVDRILADVGKEAGALPLLEHALFELWQRKQGNLLRLADYEKTGGVSRALATRADAIYDGLEADQRDIARRILLRLTQPGEETEDTRRRAAMSELVTRPAEQEAVQEVVDTLVRARLLTTDQQGAGGMDQVDVAHEALIRAWPRLREWLDEDRDGLRVHRRLTDAAQEWERTGNDPDLLYRGARLAEAQALAARSPDLLNQQEAAFLAAGVALRERELALEQERLAAAERQRKRVIAGLAAFSLVALILAAVAVWQANLASVAAGNTNLALATSQAEKSRADEEAANAVVAENTAVAAGSTAVAESTRAAQAQAAAIDSAGTAEAERNNAVAESTRAADAQQNAETQATIAATAQAAAESQAGVAATAQANAESERNVALGRQLAAQALANQDTPDLGLLLGVEANKLNPGAVDARGSLLSVLEGNPNLTGYLHGHAGSVLHMAFSSDGRLLATASADYSVLIWDMAIRQLHVPPLFRHEGEVGAVAFSPDGTLLASSDGFGTIWLWDVATGQPRGDPLTNEGGIGDLVFSPDGDQLVASIGNEILIWELANRDVPKKLVTASPSNVISSLAFSHDGDWLVSTGSDGLLLRWDITSEAPRSRLIGAPSNQAAGSQTGVGNSEAVISPDDTYVVIAGSNGTVQVRDLATGEQIGRDWVLQPDIVSNSGTSTLTFGIELSPDGRLAAVAGGDGLVRLRNMPTGTPHGQPLAGPSSGLTAITFSSDGRTIAAGGFDGSVMLWDIGPNAQLIELPGHTDSVRAVAFGPDGMVASGARDGEVILWRTDTGLDEQIVLHAHDGEAKAVAFNRAGDLLATGGTDGVIWFWDPTTGEAVGQPILAHVGGVASLAFSNDGTLLVTGGAVDGTVRMWNIETRQPHGSALPGHPNGPTAVAFGPDGMRIAASGTFGSVQLWDVETGKSLGEALTADPAEATTLAFSPDGTRLAAGGIDGFFYLWELESGTRPVQTFPAHGGGVLSVTFSPDGSRIASGGGDGRVLIWDVTTGAAEFDAPLTHPGGSAGVAFSRDGQLLASGGGDGVIRLWNPDTGASTVGAGGVLYDVAYSHDGALLATAGADSSVRLWDAATGQPIGSPFLGPSGGTRAVALNEAGTLVAAGWTNGTVRLWEIGTGKPYGKPLVGHTGFILGLAFSPDGSILASGGDDGVLRLWNTASGTSTEIPVQTSIGRVAFSPDGSLVAAAIPAASAVGVWTVESGPQLVSVLYDQGSGPFAVLFSPDGRTAAAAGVDGSIRLWDVASGQHLGPPLSGGHHGTIFGLAMSPDGRLLASSGGDAVVRLWDVETRQLLGTALAGHTGRVMSVAFDPTGTVLASAGGDNSVRLWDVDEASWRERACGIANRNLSVEEWRQYFGDRPYEPADKVCADLLGPGAVEGEAPPPATCEIGPRTVASIREVIDSVSANGDTEALRGQSFVLPSGTEADAATVAAVTESIQKFTACQNAGDYLRTFSFYTDEMIAGYHQSYPFSDRVLENIALPPLERPESMWRAVVSVREVQVLADGRIGALVTIDDPFGAPSGQETDYAYFVERDGRYLIDDAVLELEVWQPDLARVPPDSVEATGEQP